MHPRSTRTRAKPDAGQSEVMIDEVEAERRARAWGGMQITRYSLHPTLMIPGVESMGG